MGLSVYQPAPVGPGEALRAQAVRASGALDAANDRELQTLVADARRTCRTSMAAISILYDEWQYLIATAGLPIGPASRHTSFCGHAVASGAPLFCVPDAAVDARFAGNPNVEEGLLRFYAGVPVLDEENAPLGMMCVFDPKPRACLDVAEAAKLRTIADAVAVRLRALAAN